MARSTIICFINSHNKKKGSIQIFIGGVDDSKKKKYKKRYNTYK